MTRFNLIFLIYFFISVGAVAQSVQDSTGGSRSDAVRLIKSKPLKKIIVRDTTGKRNEIVPKRPDFTNNISRHSFQQLPYLNNPLFQFDPSVKIMDEGIKRFSGKEILFYSLIALLLLYALLREAFTKYVQDLFRFFFRTSLKQRQIKEQLSQTPLPSLIFNIFFFITGGLYANFLLQHFGIVLVHNFWLQFGYCFGALAAIYFVKFITLKLLGWILNIVPASESYIFVIFLINKIAGIFLIPVLIILAFTDDEVYQVAFSLSALGLAGLLIYRVILSYAAVRSQIKIRLFHFAVYIFAFEIAPLLLIYKLLIRFLL